MKTSESIKHIAISLLSAQKEITFAAKDSTNPHFKNKFAGLPAVIDAVKWALNDNGICFLQTATQSEDGKLHLVTRLLHETGEWIEDIAVCPMPKQDPQGFGSAMTYLRRYSLASICGLYQDDDDGEAAKEKINPLELTNPIHEATTMEALKKAFLISYNLCDGDKTLLRILEAAKDKRKAELEVQNG